MEPIPGIGDVITSAFLKELAEARDKVAKLVKAVGMQGISTSSINGVTGIPKEELAFVEMNRDAYEVDDARFADPGLDPDGEENADQQEFDAGEGDFVSLEGRKIQVMSAAGVVPKQGDRLWVRFSGRDNVWVPLLNPPSCNAWIRIPNGSFPDIHGWILAFEDIWDEPTQTWIQVREVYVRDANT
jgi:hypothetical protein